MKMRDQVTNENLMGVIHEFFKKLAIKKVCFKLINSPYTEPSMKISYHEGLKKWVEFGNSKFSSFLTRNIVTFGLIRERRGGGVGVKRVLCLPAPPPSTPPLTVQRQWPVSDTNTKVYLLKINILTLTKCLCQSLFSN